MSAQVEAKTHIDSASVRKQREIRSENTAATLKVMVDRTRPVYPYPLTAGRKTKVRMQMMSLLLRQHRATGLLAHWCPIRVGGRVIAGLRCTKTLTVCRRIRDMFSKFLAVERKQFFAMTGLVCTQSKTEADAKSHRAIPSAKSAYRSSSSSSEIANTKISHSERLAKWSRFCRWSRSPRNYESVS